jgi:hypothetical protein
LWLLQYVVRAAVNVASDGICVGVKDAVVPDTTIIEIEGIEGCKVEVSGTPVVVAPLPAVFVGTEPGI